MDAQKLTQKSLEAVKNAQSMAIEYNNMQIENLHLAYALLSDSEGQKNIVRKATNKVKNNEKRTKSKFATKYQERVKSIQNADTQTIENRKIAEEIAKMEAKLNKKVSSNHKSTKTSSKKKKR